MEQLVFYFFAAVAVIAAFFVVLQRKAVFSALALIVCFGSVAVLFFQLGAFFIAAIQIIVYAGAIMVLFLFVVMLIDPESEFFPASRLSYLPVVVLPIAAVLGLILFWALSGADVVSKGQVTTAGLGETGVVARSLFGAYLLPFEITSVLILVAILGAIVLAKRAD